MVLLFLIIALCIALFVLEKYNKNYNIKYKKSGNFSFYVQKKFMTNSELDFYNKIKELENFYKIIPQVNLASIVNKISNNRFQTELFRNIDFAIFNNDYSKILLLIELNDNSHTKQKRIKRDKKVKMICENAKINLITFYTKYPNNKDYVIKRILDEINKKNDIT